MIFGDVVQFDNGRWTYTNGAALTRNLISEKTGLPPLLPKKQYSPDSEPVAQLVKQIKGVMGSFQTCRDTGRGMSLLS